MLNKTKYKKIKTKQTKSYSAVNQGHCHPKIVAAMIEQSTRLCLTSRAFHNDLLGKFSKYITEYFGYEKVLSMNSGVEAGETAVKICRKWAHDQNEGRTPPLPAETATIIFAKNNFWGRTISAVSSSSDPDCYKGFGPFAPGFKMVEYNDIGAMEEAFKTTENLAGVFF